MALIKCPKCGNEVSDKADVCPGCGVKINRKGKKKGIIIAAGVLLIVIIIAVSALGVKQYNKVQEKKRQEKIQTILSDVDEYYAEGDFKNIEASYDKLDQLKYDTGKKRIILQYDEEVYDVVNDFVNTLNDVKSKLDKNSYSSLRGLLNSLKTPMNKLEKLEVNTDSEIGKYVSGVTSNIMYTAFKSEYIYNETLDVDYWLTKSTHDSLITTYVDEILKVQYPYTKEETNGNN